MIGRTPMAEVDVELPGAGLASVRVAFPGGGTGRPAGADRLDLTLGLLAWGFHGTHESEVGAFSERVRRVATAVADSPDGTLPGDAVEVATRTRGLVPVELVRWSGDRGLPRVSAALVRSAVGPVPVTIGSPAPVALAVAGLAAAIDQCAGEDADGRLALALALEGLTAWYAAAHRLTPPRDAVRSARTHAADRLRGAGRTLPPSLDDAPA